MSTIYYLKKSWVKLPFKIFIFSFLISFLVSPFAYSETSGSVIDGGFSDDEVKRGKRFFMGLLPFEREHESCVSCHYLNTPDTMNWNPSAMDIAMKYAHLDSAAFRNSVMEPTGTVMTASHQNFDIGDEDLQMVKVYLDYLAVNGPDPEKPSINRLILFLLLGIILTWALLDLIIFKKVKLKFIP
ncbi:MAG: hypothetical protein ACQETJ_14755, partial [Bacteroidota bacterium]